MCALCYKHKVLLQTFLLLVVAFSKIRQTFQSGGERVAGWLMMEGGSRVVRWQDEVKMENLDQFVMETAPQVSPLMITMMVMGGGGVSK